MSNLIPPNSNSISPSDPSSSSSPVSSSSVQPVDANTQAAAQQSIASGQRVEDSERGKLLLRIFEDHSVTESGMFLPISDMDNVHRVLNAGRERTSKQRLRECCFADTATLNKLIGPSISSTKRAHSELPGRLESYIEQLTEDEAGNLLRMLIDPDSEELIEQDPGKVFLNAVREQKTMLFDFLCAAGPACAAVEQGLKAEDEDGRTALMQAISLEDLELVKALVNLANTPELKHELIAHRNPGGWTAFMCGALTGNVGIMQFLYDAELPGNRAGLFMEKNEGGQIPIMLAPTSEATDFLIEKGVAEGPKTRDWFLSACDEEGRTALCFAVMIAGASLSEVELGGEGMLDERFVGQVEVLLRAGASPADRDNGGVTVLMHAANTGNVAVAEKLLNSMNEEDQATLLAATDLNGRTTFMHAALQSDNELMLDFLFRKIPDEDRANLFTQQDIVGNTSLMLAVGAGSRNVEYLIELAEQVNVEIRGLVNMHNQDQRTVFDLAEDLEEGPDREVIIHVLSEAENPPG